MIDIGNVNPAAVLGAGVVSFLLGFVWYTLLFSKTWMMAMGLKREDVDSSGLSMVRAITGSLAASLATAVGVALLLSGVQPVSPSYALAVGALAWAAFSLTPMVKMVFWEDRPLTLLAIDGGYEFVSIAAIALILVAWP